ncbi:MAG: protein kinase domain-containing protein, partial [Acidimicrobiales bacterium]
KGPLPTDRCAALGSSLAGALAYVHEQGIVHRDVKPGNVLLGPGPRVRLTDFGIAQLLDASTLTVTGTTLGTAAYMAPEQLEHHRVGAAADVWSLGAILLECLTGRRGFQGNPAEIMARRLSGAAPSSEEDLPSPWRILLASMLEHDPSRRPDAGEVAEMLLAPAYTRPWAPDPTRPSVPLTTAAAGTLMAAGSGPPTDPERTTVGTPTAFGAPAPRRRRRRRTSGATLLIVAAVLVALAGALSAWALSGTSSPPPSPSTTTTTSSTTTTTAPNASSASATLVRDVQAGEANGSLTSDVGRTILDQLGQALAAAASGDNGHSATVLGNIDDTVASAAQSGAASPDEATTLFSDVAALATVLGVPTPTTTTTTPAPPKPKHDH